MNATQFKIQKTSRGLSVVIRIVEIFMIVGGVLSAMGLAVLLGRRPEMLGLFVDVGTVADPQAAAGWMPWLIGLLVATMAVAAAGCHQLYRVFKDVSGGATPFSAQNVRRIKAMAWLSAPMSLLSGTTKGLHLLIETGAAGNVMGIEGVWLLFGAVVYCLALIFDYGCKLQQESDETL